MRRRPVDPDLVRTMCDRAGEVARRRRQLHFTCRIDPSGVSAACTPSRKPGDAFHGLLTKSAAAAPTTAAKASVARPGRLRIIRRSLVPRRVDPRSPVSAGWKLAAVRLRSERRHHEVAEEVKLRHADQLLLSREECVRFRRELASCDLACPMKPCAHRPDRDVECERYLLVAEGRQREEEQRIALPGTHRRRAPASRAPSASTRDVASSS